MKSLAQLITKTRIKRLQETEKKRIASSPETVENDRRREMNNLLALFAGPIALIIASALIGVTVYTIGLIP